MGRLDRIIEIQRWTITRDPRFGSEIVTWVKVEDVWAEQVWVKPAERYLESSKRRANVSTKRFKILAGVDVDETMRVIDDYGETWDILGIIKNDQQYLTLQLEHRA